MVCKLDRIARSLKHLLQVLDELQAKGVEFRSLADRKHRHIDAGRADDDADARGLCRVRAGDDPGAHAGGAKGGRGARCEARPPSSVEPYEEREVVRRFRADGVTKSALAREYGIHISSIKRALRRAETQRELFDPAT